MQVFWARYWLARRLPLWVAGLLVWQLWQRRWGRAAALGLLAGMNVLVLHGYQFALFVSSISAKPT